MSAQIESSPIAETDEDYISGKFCECKHLLSEHSLGKCYALSNNGTILSACRCENPKPIIFQVRVSITQNHVKTPIQ